MKRPLQRAQATFLALGLAVALAACDSPVDTGKGRAYSAVTTGGDHSCALTMDGEAYCWGAGGDAELGTGFRADEFRPARVQTELRFKAITAGDAHTCALTTDGRAFCWGYNSYFQRGNAYDPGEVPVAVQTDARFKSISAGAHHTCAVAEDDRVFCWGYNRYGQDGNTYTVNTVPPYPVAGDFHAVAVSAGGFHTCALTAAGKAFCWGRNDYAQLGIDSAVLMTTVPVAVQTNLVFSQIDAGATHTCGIADHAVYCWGSSAYGEIGDGGSMKPGVPGPTSPVQARALPPMSAVSAGEFQTCAISDAGVPFCWGRGLYGQIGLGPTQDTALPRELRVDGDVLRFSELATGGRTHMCGVAQQRVFCWGTGLRGQLGIGNPTTSAQPQQVVE